MTHPGATCYLEEVLRGPATGTQLERLARRVALAAHVQRGGRIQLALLSIEVHPQNPTETLPPAVADRASTVVRELILGALDPADTLSRLGPLRYLVLLERSEEGAFAVHAADDIVIAVRHADIGSNLGSPLVASVGISVFPDDGESLEELMGCAEAAGQAARITGGDLFGFYSGSLSEAASRRLAIERAIPDALKRGELVLAYQPQLDTRDGTLVGVEALLRWNHPKLGPVPPEEFVSVLESTDLIGSAGSWVLAEGCRQVAAWSRSRTPIRLGVNVSAAQLRSSDFEEIVLRAVADSGLTARQLELELTESVLLEDEPHVRTTLAALRRTGVRVALDDFGTGYASLAYLRQFPMDTLKIDRQFVRGLPVDTMNAAITSAIIAMARSLGLSVVAEGVETEAEEEYLHSLDCFVVQGFRYARPMLAPVLEGWLAERPWA